MNKTKITYKGQITIPKEIRDALAIKEGNTVIFQAKQDHAILKPLKKSLTDFYGALPATRSYPGTEKIRKEIQLKLSQDLPKKGKL